MNILIFSCIIIYCIVSACFHVGITEEWKLDTSGEIDHLNPTFVKLMIFCTSLCWPLLLVYHGYLKFKERT